MSARHREALAHLLYGLGEGGGFVQLTGEVGTGKTSICRCLLEQVPENVDLALVFNPKVTSIELIATVCDELCIEYPQQDASIKMLTDVLNHYLLQAHARGRRTVLVIDEAQNLSADVLEQVRLLTNLGTASMQLLQIILIGQPELRTLLQREDMRQLAQRVTARYHLEPVTREDTEAYIKHRLRISGTTRPLFNKASIDLIYRLSGGIPRLINVLCDRALLGAYSEGKLQIDRKIVRQAAQELTGSELPSSRLDPGPRWLFIGAAGLILLGIALYAYWRGPQSGRAPDQRAVQASVAQATADQGATAMRANERSVVDPAPQAPMAQAADDLPEASIPDSPDRPLSTEAEPASLAALLAEFDDTRALAAWTGLFSRWSVKLPADVAPEYCVFASDVGLYCLVGQGSWGLLRQYNRPAVIGLVSGDGQTVPALLQHLDGQLAELLVGEETLRLPTGEVDRYWLGDFTLLLRSPPNGHLLLRAGDRNADVLWLRQLLEQAQQTKLTSDDPQYFDFPLQKQVLEFQRSHGLTADGVVGKDTLLQLNTYGDRQVPLLSVEAP